MGTILISRGGNKVEFGVSNIPHRKNKALIKIRGAMVEPLAYFRNNQCAKEFNGILDMIVEMYNKD